MGLYELLELERGKLSAIFQKIIMIVRICLFIHKRMIISILDLSSYLLEKLLISTRTLLSQEYCKHIGCD